MVSYVDVLLAHHIYNPPQRDGLCIQILNTSENKTVTYCILAMAAKETHQHREKSFSFEEVLKPSSK